MPIKINGDIDAVAKVSKQIYTAKFFSKDITGSGKSTGLLNTNIYPANIPAKAPEYGHDPHWSIKTEFDKFTKRTIYPLNPLGCYVPTGIKNAINFDTSWCHISNQNAIYDRYATISPVSFTISESLASAQQNNGSANGAAANNNTSGSNISNAAASSGKRAIVSYCMMIIDVDKTTKDVFIRDYAYTANPLVTFNNILTVSAADKNAFYDYLTHYNLHAEICHQSELWQTKLIDIIIDAYDKDKNMPMYRFVRYLAQYKVTLQQYRDFYAALKQRFTADELNKFTKMNTSLLLQNTLDNLTQTQFSQLPVPGTTNKQLDLSWCSAEQFKAITSDKPLNLVQAGAGTGKSTVIKSRLDYLDYLGLDLNKVMVLSFTNAAADNIKARCPGIQSMTIAKMIDTIYCQNHPTHQLSPSLARRGEGSTFTNSLELYRNSLPLIPELIHATDLVEKHNDYATLLRLVEENYDDIMKILDTVGQTTFHLEIIICYLEHATMNIPFDIEHLLIDEVQDNAIFEFIFFLNLTCKLKNHLYLVGDCSQTLYEFRASDPKALNAIESSGLFATYPLNVNYRSNQNILQFANVLLDDIEANQHANIQLQAFRLNTVTKQSFEDAVTVDYNRLDKISEMKEWVGRKLRSPNMAKWIDDKLSKGEQICILAYKRREAAIFQTELEKLYPNSTHISIIPAKNVSFAYFSRYVSANRSSLLALPTTSAADLVARVRAEILASLPNYHITPQSANYNKIVASINAMLHEWQTENIGVIQDAITQFHAKAITQQRLAEIVGETLIDFEIQKNALKQSMVSQKNANKKEDTDNANFIYSTIHSAKGLEFDNVILLYQNKNSMEEETKRMYYVALTRAKKGEYVLAYDTVLNALVQTRYDAVMAHLPDANASSSPFDAAC